MRRGASKETDPDHFPWAIFVKELCHESLRERQGGQCEQALALLHKMRDAGTTANVISFSAAISALWLWRQGST